MNKKILILIFTLISGFILYLTISAYMAHRVGNSILGGYKEINQELEENKKHLEEENKRVNENFKKYTDSIIKNNKQ